jgi:hypothetical protein
MTHKLWVPSHCLQVSEGDDLGSLGVTLEWQG